jgi:hypothetical protein
MPPAKRKAAARNRNREQICRTGFQAALPAAHLGADARKWNHALGLHARATARVCLTLRRALREQPVLPRGEAAEPPAAAKKLKLDEPAAAAGYSPMILSSNQSVTALCALHRAWRWVVVLGRATAHRQVC